MTRHAHDGTPLQSGPDSALVTGSYRGFSAAGFREAVVIEKFHKNSKGNRSRRYMEYTIRDVRTGTLLYGARRSEAMGGKDDGEENVLRPAAATLNGEPFSKQTRAQNTDGDHVVYMMVEGSRLRPVIVGVLQHPSSEYGGTEKDGRRTFKIHQGTSFEVKEDGTFQFTRRVDKNKQTVLTVNADGTVKTTMHTGTSVEFNGDGEVTIKSKANATIVMDKNGAITTTSSSNQFMKVDQFAKVAGETDFMLLGTTFRTAQSAMHKAISVLCSQVAPGPQLIANITLALQGIGKAIDAFEQALASTNGLSKKAKLA